LVEVRLKRSMNPNARECEGYDEDRAARHVPADNWKCRVSKDGNPPVEEPDVDGRGIGPPLPVPKIPSLPPEPGRVKTH